MASEYQCEWLRWRCLLAIKTCMCTLTSWMMYDYTADRLMERRRKGGRHKGPYYVYALAKDSEAQILAHLVEKASSDFLTIRTRRTGQLPEAWGGMDRELEDCHTAWKDSLATDYTAFGIVEPSEAGEPGPGPGPRPRLYTLRRALFYDMDEYKALSPHVQRDLTGAREGCWRNPAPALALSLNPALVPP